MVSHCNPNMAQPRGLATAMELADLAPETCRRSHEAGYRLEMRTSQVIGICDEGPEDMRRSRALVAVVQKAEVTGRRDGPEAAN
jgi:hypothetical protein